MNESEIGQLLIFAKDQSQARTAAMYSVGWLTQEGIPSTTGNIQDLWVSFGLSNELFSIAPNIKRNMRDLENSGHIKATKEMLGRNRLGVVYKLTKKGIVLARSMGFMLP
jgi:hypothetical protein